MKKITALVLALVLVFAFAGSALALTNRQPNPGSTSGAQIVLDLQIISYITGLPGVGYPINWAAINSEAAAYLEGQAIYFNAQVNQGAAAAVPVLPAVNTSIQTAYKDYGANLNIASTGVDLSLASVGVVNTTQTGVVLAPTVPTVTDKGVSGFNTRMDDSTAIYIYNYTFNGVVTAASPVVTAKLTVGPADVVVDGTYALYGATAGYPHLYDVAVAGATYTVTEVADASYSLEFALKTDLKLDTLTYALGANEYLVSRVVDVGGATHWAFTPQGAAAPLNATQTSAAIADVDAIFAFFGFDWALNGIIWDIDFVCKGQFVYTDTVNVKTATATINTGDDDDVPVTGDSASVFGFVMIGVAIIAAASLAVVAKKAR